MDFLIQVRSLSYKDFMKVIDFFKKYLDFDESYIIKSFYQITFI